METVGDIMTRSVLAVRPETPLKEVARLLVERRISGLPVVDDAGRVLGVVSEADLLVKEQDPEALPRRPLARIFGDSAETRRLLAKAEARTAGDAMTAPAITIDAGQSVHAAAALMIGRKVNRLPVIADGRLVGIVTRADIVRTFVRTDEELAEAIRGEVLHRALWVDLSKVTVEVADGVATIRGEVERRATVAMVERMVEMVPGVVGVTVHLAWSIDDQAFEAPAPDYFSPKGPS
ncbi:MAG: CBS domain-containing protein [Chloroflexi bacterium]|nr:CBS domain-containing protein [Chloroflexota bacterium]